MKWSGYPTNQNSYTTSVNNPADILAYGICTGTNKLVNTKIVKNTKTEPKDIIKRHLENLEDSNDCK